MMNSRRSFMWKLGAGASAAITAAVGSAKPAASGTDDPVLRAAMLEDEKALRSLHQRFELAMDNGQFQAAVDLFAADAEVVFNRTTFAGRDQGINRLFLIGFRAGRTGKRMEAAPGLGSGADCPCDAVQVAADRRTATAIFPFSIQVGMPVGSENSLAAMARLHGEGVRTWWEGGNYHVSYAKDAASDIWQISRLEYRTLARADYRAGRSYASPMPASPMGHRDLAALIEQALV
jgi:hypothetical protein